VKKTTVLMMVMMLTVVFASVAMAHRVGIKETNLLLFQKCDECFIGEVGYDAFGCPDTTVTPGPWAILTESRRYGQLKYNQWGDKFSFLFEGKGLDCKKSYTLIYYPDPWPGKDLICLASGRPNRSGTLILRKALDIPSLPIPTDANFSPVTPSGAVGAKIWLVPSDDVDCTEGSSQMTDWNPTDILFEGNLIIYQDTDL
jgi:hypothetical protein